MEGFEHGITVITVTLFDLGMSTHAFGGLRCMLCAASLSLHYTVSSLVLISNTVLGAKLSKTKFFTSLPIYLA
jgi:hypothetical protein